MVDVRIYRVALAIVFVAIVVFGFSLENTPGGLSTNLAAGQFFTGAYASAETLASSYGAPSPGSGADDAMAQRVAATLRAAGGFTVNTQTTVARTAAGERALQTVEATRAGLGSGTIVIVAPRDASGALTSHHASAATTSGTAVMMELAHALSGETLNRTVMLASVSGSVGNAGMAQLLRTLPAGVDAVIVLGDLASSNVSRPVVVPWSNSDLLAPEELRQTLSSFVHSETGITAGGSGLGGQIAHLAFPVSVTGQTPFARAGIPAVTLSLSGQRLPTGLGATDPARTAELGNALLLSVSALENGASVPAPSTYLSVSSMQIPVWAVRLLVLGFLAPVGIALLDGIARARRRGHSVLSWAVWVLAGAVPFVVGWLVLKLAGVTHALADTPPGAVAGGVRFTLAGAAVIMIALVLTAASFRLLRPLVVQVATSIGWRRTPKSPAVDGAVVALEVVLLLLALAIWVVNPFAAALLVPALHLWLWLSSPALRHRWQMALLILFGLLGPVLVILYYALALGLTPWGLAWSVTLLVAGGGMSITAGIAWCLALGTVASGVVLAIRAAGRAAPEEPEVTVRGPMGYAGPGSLGGTQSALRR